jgi:exonuclease VII small subunit
MQQIEGIDLTAELEEVRHERLAGERIRVRKAINGIYQDLHRWLKELEQAENTAKKCREKINAAQAKLTKLTSGDWSVLKEEEPQKPTSE